jgi:hypothetical protein
MAALESARTPEGLTNISLERLMLAVDRLYTPHLILNQ